MKNKTVILILSILAVAMYTTAVINFCLGNVLSGIADVLMASSDALMAYSLYHVGQVGCLAAKTGKGDSADEGTIIEELHNKLMAAEDKIVGLEKERQLLADKISRNYLGELLRAVNVMQQGLQEKKHKIQQIESGLAAISAVMDKMKSEEVKE